MWDKITVGEFLAIYKISLDSTTEEEDKICSIISILHRMTLAEVDELPLSKFNQLARESSFALNVKDIPGKAVRSIRVGKKKYGIIYDVSKLRHRQYVEVSFFSQQPIENMHLIMASLVQPIKWGVRLKNKGSMHVRIAADLLNARLIDVYHSCVFFCKVFLSSMQSLDSILTNQLMEKGVPQNKAKTLLSISKSVLAGSIPQTKLQHSKG